MCDTVVVEYEACRVANFVLLKDDLVSQMKRRNMQEKLMEHICEVWGEVNVQTECQARITPATIGVLGLTASSVAA